MELTRIKELVEKYYECETSLEEERELKAYFTSGDVADELKEYIPLFRYYEEEKKTGNLDGLFDEQVLAQIEKSGTAPKQGRVVRLFGDIAKVAAVGLILVTAGYFVREELKKDEVVQPYLADTFEDPEKAFEETKKALQLISKNFNKGRKQAKKLGVLHEAQQQVTDNNL